MLGLRSTLARVGRVVCIYSPNGCAKDKGEARTLAKGRVTVI